MSSLAGWETSVTIGLPALPWAGTPHWNFFLLPWTWPDRNLFGAKATWLMPPVQGCPQQVSDSMQGGNEVSRRELWDLKWPQSFAFTSHLKTVHSDFEWKLTGEPKMEPSGKQVLRRLGKGHCVTWTRSPVAGACLPSPQQLHKTLSPLPSLHPFSPRAWLRLGTPLRAWRTSAAGPTSSRSQTQATTNTMIMPSSSHGRTSGPQACKVSLTPPGVRKEGGQARATGPARALGTLAQAREGYQGREWWLPYPPGKSLGQC